MEIRAALVWALLQLSLYCKNRGRTWRSTTAVGSSSGHLTDNHDCQPNRTVSIRKYSQTWKQAHREEAWRCLVKFSSVPLMKLWTSSSSPSDSTPGGSTGVLISGYKGSRCCRCDTQRPSPYLWPCSSLRRSGSCWNETWHFVLQRGHWSDSSRCANGVSGHLKSKKNKIVTFRTSSIFTLNWV